MDPVTRKPWVWQVTVLSILLGMLGVLIVTAIGSTQVAERKGIPSGGYAGLLSAWTNLKETNTSLQKEINDLNRKLIKYEGIIAQGSGAVDAVRQELDQARFLAGLTAVTGPGLTVALQDSRNIPQDAPTQVVEEYLIHDYDIRNIVNELRAAGAEAVSINGQRVVATTAIRCVGPVIQVNGTPVSSPFVITATGPSKVLEAGLRLPGGQLLGFMSVDPKMVRIERRDKVNIPAYSGSTDFKYTNPVR